MGGEAGPIEYTIPNDCVPRESSHHQSVGTIGQKSTIPPQNRFNRHERANLCRSRAICN
ncbi:hypothetical protein RBSH_04754 [Rhodopirellula baltica SH28]|uniref:Uncharacterized protein n=2 Tax=Rhodopirellula baltica TaxID=265606 RepID=F2AR12_RHOBT|nr:hypothetical protein RBWH47_01133 [Rhodopirellula baltica WH47]EKK00047.1 hypothetical protein RBSH_04754 [Rhodopirellula baltica SH28]